MFTPQRQVGPTSRRSTREARGAAGVSTAAPAAAAPRAAHGCTCGGGCPRCKPQYSLQAADARPAAFDAPFGDAKESGVRRAGRKAVCLVPGSFQITMDEDRNDAARATGRLHFAFRAEGLSRHYGGAHQPFASGPRERDAQGKLCDCDCMAYRQYIRGAAFSREPSDAHFSAETKIRSAHWELPLDGNWHEENTSTIVGRSAHGCDREYEDHPGVTHTRGNGTMWLARLNFLLQIWDHCTQRAVREPQQTLTVGGDEPPRWIHWDRGWLPLTREAIRLSYAGIDGSARARGEKE